jgi:phospholipase/lecithinase/hemolysin
MKYLFVFGLALTSGYFSQTANGSAIDALYTFGDSLSDVGNIYTVTGNTIPGAPYVNGQFSNGPIWVQDFAAGLGLAPLRPSVQGGTDYAWAGAQTGTTPFNAAGSTDLAGATGQLSQFQAAHATADPNALYVIQMGGGNDFGSIPPGSTPAQTAAVIAAMAGNIDTAIGTLAGAGAKNFLIVSALDLGKLPIVAALGPNAQAGASAFASQFDNTVLFGAGSIPSLASIATADSLSLKVLDAYTLLDLMVANPATYGFTDVVDPCVTGAVNFVGGTACAASTAAQNKYLFWDQFHPTAAAGAVIGNAALAVVTPEPVSLALTAAGLVYLCLTRRRRVATTLKTKFGFRGVLLHAGTDVNKQSQRD